MKIQLFSVLISLLMITPTYADSKGKKDSDSWCEDHGLLGNFTFSIEDDSSYTQAKLQPKIEELLQKKKKQAEIAEAAFHSALKLDSEEGAAVPSQDLTGEIPNNGERPKIQSDQLSPTYAKSPRGKFQRAVEDYVFLLVGVSSKKAAHGKQVGYMENGKLKVASIYLLRRSSDDRDSFFVPGGKIRLREHLPHQGGKPRYHFLEKRYDELLPVTEAHP
jgi:hypothetical protein